MNIEVGTTDNFDPEVQAMLLAMYSRNFGPIAERLPDSEESTQQHKEKLGKFYVNWGHKSVGQLGVTTVWLEGVSQLAAKAIENHQLFNGQESSTRYIDYSNQPMYSVDPEITEWQEKWRDFYIKTLPLVVQDIEAQYPFDLQYSGDMTEDQMKKNQTIYKNTVKARAFDICRGFLPAGSTTNVGFMGTFDTLNDHFGEMLHHPCQEMRDIAIEVLTKMKAKYPYGTMDIDKLAERFGYVNDSFFYHKSSTYEFSKKLDMVVDFSESTLNIGGMNGEYYKRRKGEKVDRLLDQTYRFTFKGLLDFGSYRDLHRHRNGFIDMHELTPLIGFGCFYHANIPDELLNEFFDLQSNFIDWYQNSNLSIYEKQYAVPMGYEIPFTYKCGLNQALYIMELRTGKTVHNSLRWVIQDWVTSFNSKVFIPVYADMDKDNFTLKRGTQTFEIPTMDKPNVI